MRVMPPPLPVPRLMVVNSRMTLRSPITSSACSPWNFLSWGSPPIAAWPWMRLSRPMRVGPRMLQWAPMLVPSPISTPGPTRVKAPIETPLPIRADGSTTALAWMPAAASMSVLGFRAEDLGAGDLLAVDPGDAVEQGHAADGALERHAQFQPVARDHHGAELRVVDLDEIEHLATDLAILRHLDQQAAGLGQRLEHQHPGHRRLAGKMALEERLVDGHALVADDAAAALEFGDPVHQQERVAVGQQLLDGDDVERQLHWILPWLRD